MLHTSYATKKNVHSHNHTRFGFSVFGTELIGVELAHFALGGPYERATAECPAVHDHVRASLARLVGLAVDGVLRRSQVLVNADAVTSLAAQRAGGRFTTAGSADSVTQPRLHTWQTAGASQTENSSHLDDATLFHIL